MNLSDEQLAKVVKKLNYEFCPPGKNVFNFGDGGDKFYLIIEGGVNIIICCNFKGTG